jgi:hypothetical protein
MLRKLPERSQALRDLTRRLERIEHQLQNHPAPK